MKIALKYSQYNSTIQMYKIYYYEVEQCARLYGQNDAYFFAHNCTFFQISITEKQIFFSSFSDYYRCMYRNKK